MWWEGMDITQRTAFIIACAATLILIIQIIIMLVGGEIDADVSTDVTDISGASDVDLDGDGIADSFSGGVSDGEVSGSGGGGAAHFGFRLLSLRSILALLAVGGWVTYTVGYVLNWYFALIIGVVAGLAAACLMAAAIIGIEKLQANGTINPVAAISKSGTAYLAIPPKRSGKGKVSVLVSERYKEYDAVTDSEEAIPTGANITVIAHLGDNLLLVKKSK
ncbi:MAG: hypothetical protein J1F33_02295 [Clostridiales bacterium]|nr:hypothetical protein [Clostridiales bacterium]